MFLYSVCYVYISDYIIPGRANCYRQSIPGVRQSELKRRRDPPTASALWPWRRPVSPVAPKKCPWPRRSFSPKFTEEPIGRRRMHPPVALRPARRITQPEPRRIARPFPYFSSSISPGLIPPGTSTRRGTRISYSGHPESTKDLFSIRFHYLQLSPH